MFDHFLEDFKADRDPTVILRAAINDLEQGRIDPELLKIRVKLAKSPEDYADNNPKKKIVLSEQKQETSFGITKTSNDVSKKPSGNRVLKYKEILMAPVKETLLDCRNSEIIESTPRNLRCLYLDVQKEQLF